MKKITEPILKRSCTICKDEKSIELFSQDKYATGGHSYKCKKCDYKSHQKRLSLAPWKKHLQWMRSRCNNPRTNGYERYGGRGIKSLITSEELKVLWFRDKANEMLRPSLDRKNSDLDYIFENCQFIEVKDNSKKLTNKPVIQLSLEGQFIKEWPSLISASNYIGKNNTTLIKNCIKGVVPSVGGYIWRFKLPESGQGVIL